MTRLFAVRKETMRREAAYGFTRTYNEKIMELRSSGGREASGFSSSSLHFGNENVI